MAQVWILTKKQYEVSEIWQIYVQYIADVM